METQGDPWQLTLFAAIYIFMVCVMIIGITSGPE